MREADLATAQDIAALKQDVEQDVRTAVSHAKAAPLPAADDMEGHLYG